MNPRRYFKCGECPCEWYPWWFHVTEIRDGAFDGCPWVFLSPLPPWITSVLFSRSYLNHTICFPERIWGLVYHFCGAESHQFPRIVLVFLGQKTLNWLFYLFCKLCSKEKTLALHQSCSNTASKHYLHREVASRAFQEYCAQLYNWEKLGKSLSIQLF